MSIALVCACVAVVRYESALPPIVSHIEQQVGQQVEVKGVVLSDIDVRETTQKITISLIHAEGTSIESIPTKVLVSVSRHTPVAYGDVLRVVGTLEHVQTFETRDGHVFDYPSYLLARGIRYHMEYPAVEVLSHGEASKVRAALISVRARYVEGLQSVLPEPHAGLAAGITVGDKRSVGPELTDMFTSVSLVHILVLSGYNITVILTWLLEVFRGSRRHTRVLCGLLIIMSVVGIAGFSTSALRAGLMAGIALLAREGGRTYIALHALGLVAVLMVFWNPLLLAFDPGFQLSVLATLGLILGTDPLMRFLRWIPRAAGLREITASTIATQGAVLPLLMYMGGTFTTLSLIANVLVLLIVPLCMAASLGAGIFGALLGHGAVPIAYPAYLLLSYVLGATRFFSEHTTYLSLPPISGAMVIGTYLLACVAIALVWRWKATQAS